MAATLMLFWDYDTQWGADRSRSGGGPKSWGHLEFSGTDRILDLLAEQRIPACFAVVGSAALAGEKPYHAPRQVVRIHDAGHEVASHGHEHEWIPGLRRDQVAQVLRESKDALEQVVGDPVVTFVPPYNQPFDCPSRFSVSLSERIRTRGRGVNLDELCSLLGETGYRVCRVSYRSVFERVLDILAPDREPKEGRVQIIRGIKCLRLNSPCGFDQSTIQAVQQQIDIGGIAVVYAHPHSLTLPGPQRESCFLGFLDFVSRKRAEGLVSFALPSSLDNDAY